MLFRSWVEPKQIGSHDSCAQCGRKVGNNAFYVEVNIGGQILKNGLLIDDKPSQGCWAIGRECAKSFDPSVLVKMEA